MTETQPAIPRPPRRRGLTFWLWVVFGSVLALLAAPFVVGVALPTSYTGVASVEIARPPAEVWSAVADYERFPLSSAHARVGQPVHDLEEQPAWFEELPNRRCLVTTLASDPPERVRRHMRDEDSPLACDWDIRVEPAGAGSRLVVEQRCEMRGSRLAAPQLRFVMFFLHGAAMAPRAYAKRLASALDPGAP